MRTPATAAIATPAPIAAAVIGCFFIEATTFRARPPRLDERDDDDDLLDADRPDDVPGRLELDEDDERLLLPPRFDDEADDPWLPPLPLGPDRPVLPGLLLLFVAMSNPSELVYLFRDRSTPPLHVTAAARALALPGRRDAIIVVHVRF